MRLFRRIFLYLASVAFLTAAPHQNWRLLMTACNGCGGPTAEVIVKDLEMYDAAGNYLPVGGAANADRSDNGTVPGNAFDRNNSTSWEGYTVPTTVSPRWLCYHFTAPVSVATVRLVEWTPGTGPSSSLMPMAFKMQYSDDAGSTCTGGMTWTDATGTLIPQAWSTQDSFPSWSFTVDPPLGGFFVNWRVSITAIQGGGVAGRNDISELGFKDTAGGSIITSSTNTNYMSVVGPGVCCANALTIFDRSLSTNSSFGGVPGGAFAGYSFEKPYKVIETDISNINDSSWTGNSPSAWSVQGSNDAGMNWFTAFSCTATWTGQGQTKVCGAVLDQRGNIAYNQIRADDRMGNAHQIQMFGGGQTVAGHSAAYDGQANLIDSGVYTFGRVNAPVSHTDPCTVNQVAIDSLGSFYFCYATNLWAKIGPGGYSNSF